MSRSYPVRAGIEDPDVRPYGFTLNNTRGDKSTFRFWTFADAFEHARQNGRPRVYFRDANGVEHLCENIPGQEGRRD